MAPMKHSTERILTTHAGRLDGPRDLREMTFGFMSGRGPDLATVMARVQSGITETIRKQADAGIDIISDGELGKIGFGFAYYGRRLSGLATRKVNPGETGWMGGHSGERAEFAEFYKDLNFEQFLAPEKTICNGPIAYIGQEEVANDIALFKRALAEAGARAEETFLCVLAPGWLEHFFHNEYYPNDEAYLFALADAMKHEYKAIVDAGFIHMPHEFIDSDRLMVRSTVRGHLLRRPPEMRVSIDNHGVESSPMLSAHGARIQKSRPSAIGRILLVLQPAEAVSRSWFQALGSSERLMPTRPYLPASRCTIQNAEMK